MTIAIASEESWDWKICAVCGSEDIADRGLIIITSPDGTPLAARMGWCNKLECRDDSEQTNYAVVNTEEAEKLDASIITDAAKTFESGYEAALADMRWLADARDHYTSDEVQFQTRTVRQVTDIIEGKNDAFGWLPSWLWDEWASKRSNQGE